MVDADQGIGAQPGASCLMCELVRRIEMRNTRRLAFLALSACLAASAGPSRADDAFVAAFQDRLASADMEGAADLASERLVEFPGDAQAQFALGAAQFLGAVEGLGQGLYDHGLVNNFEDLFGIPGVTNLPFLRLPVGRNPTPEPFSAADFRVILAEFDHRLLQAEVTLSKVPPGAVLLPLAVQAIALDFNDNGKAEGNESLPSIIHSISGTGLRPDFPRIGFDESDVPWLRGYAHLLAGITDILLAHDWTETVNLTFQTAFPDAGLASSALNETRPALLLTLQQNQASNGECHNRRYQYWDEVTSPEETAAMEKEARCYAAQSALRWGGLGDLVAFFHLFRWPVVDAARLVTARQHFLSMISLSRASWASITAETDNMGEWVPAPYQTGPFPSMRVDYATMAGWMRFLDQAEGVLNGTLLLPHWRFDRSQGVNLRRMFEEPRTLDPVMIFSGAGAIPYMETGTLAKDSTLDTGLDIVDGGLLAYFLWFN
jgi:hypothetical protein